jgi:hypothetical protein
MPTTNELVESIRGHLKAAADKVLEYIREKERASEDGWVSAAQIKNDLELNLVCVPLGSDHGQKGWVFGALARNLEDRRLVEYEKRGGRAYYRSSPRI